MSSMALIVDQQSAYKNFCKICNKGFVCGQALGGHMRAHGIGDDQRMDEKEDQTSDWEDNLAIDHDDVNYVDPSNDKKMYALRTNPNRLKSTRVCENCDKEFVSWKSFLEHKNGKCISDDAHSIISSPRSDTEDYSTAVRSGGWSKRKRSLRTKVDDNKNNNHNNHNNIISNYRNYNDVCPSSEEEDLANCLMLLSNTVVNNPLMTVEPEESCASASKDDDKKVHMNFIIPPTYREVTTKATVKGLFECKACKKVFNSHQALGGHRASHKKVKGCFAARLLDNQVSDAIVVDDETFSPKFDPGSSTITTSPKRKSSKVHECSICQRVFASGQALGGHKRCHWITSNSPTATTTTTTNEASLASKPPLVKTQQRPTAPVDLTLELNLHASDGATNAVFNYPNRALVGRDHIFGKQGRIVYKKDDNKNNGSDQNVWLTLDDEAESKVKLAKLSELKDINVNGSSSSPWLQVGIGSTANVGAHL